MRYYFLMTLFPHLTIGEKPDISYRSVQELLEINLTAKDKKKLKLLQSSVDLSNLLLFWLKKPLNPRGNFTQAQMEEGLATQTAFFDFIFTYQKRYPLIEERLHEFPSLWHEWIEYLKKERGFLSWYAEFEWQLNLVLGWLRAKEKRRSFDEVFHYENKDDLFLNSLIGKDSCPKEYEPLSRIFTQYKEKPEELEFRLLEFRFQRIEEKGREDAFSIDQVLAYVVLLRMAEEWAELDREMGHKAVETMLGV